MCEGINTAILQSYNPKNFLRDCSKLTGLQTAIQTAILRVSTSPRGFTRSRAQKKTRNMCAPLVPACVRGSVTVVLRPVVYLSDDLFRHLYHVAPVITLYSSLIREQRQR